MEEAGSGQRQWTAEEDATEGATSGQQVAQKGVALHPESSRELPPSFFPRGFDQCACWQVPLTTVQNARGGLRGSGLQRPVSGSDCESGKWVERHTAEV